MNRFGPRGMGPWLVAATVLLGGFLLLPFLALLLRVSPAVFIARLGSRDVLDALGLSVVTSLAATGVAAAFGVPVAWLLATREFPGKRAVEVLLDLPMVLPPTVAGFALLMAFGRAGLAGRALALAGLSLPFTTLGVVVAQVFMAVPFFVGPARAGFASVDRRLLEAAATLRAGESVRFRRVALPLARPAILAGAAMAAARSLGEFGATITFAGNLPGRTQTMPLAVYMAMQSDLDAAVTLSVVLLLMAAGLLAALRSAPPGWAWNRSRAAG
jgi:molybdate transport system permease protein